MQWNRGPGNRFAWMFNCGGRLRFWFFVCTRNRIHARDVTRVIGPLTRLRVHYLLDWTSQNRVCCWPPLFCCFFLFVFFSLTTWEIHARTRTRLGSSFGRRPSLREWLFSRPLSNPPHSSSRTQPWSNGRVREPNWRSECSFSSHRQINIITAL